MIVGIDEVGRGAWAGPLAVGAVALGGKDIPGLTDSKKLTAKKRQEFAKIIKSTASGIGLGWVSARDIDRLGLSRALKMAAQRAIKDINTPYTQIIIDGTVKLLDDERVTTMKQADLLVPSVSAASIVAKVARDYYMSEIAHAQFPNYGFDRHVGYGTKAHHDAIHTHGCCQLHRASFAPIRAIMGNVIVASDDPTVMTEGQMAEDIAAAFLKKKGFEIIEQNWRTKWCEIDIIVSKNSVIYFVEVKHRAQSRHGDGFDAITKKKLNQMNFAARLWRQKFNHTGDARLAVIATTGEPPKVDDWLPNIS